MLNGGLFVRQRAVLNFIKQLLLCWNSINELQEHHYVTIQLASKDAANRNVPALLVTDSHD